jgi:hypothetical protein
VNVKRVQHRNRHTAAMLPNCWIVERSTTGSTSAAPWPTTGSGEATRLSHSSVGRQSASC